MGTKMTVAFAVIFMADLKKRLLAASPLKPLVWGFHKGDCSASVHASFSAT